MATLKQHCIDIFRAGVAGVQPMEALLRKLRLDGTVLTAGESADWRRDLTTVRRVVVVGFGKAAPAMAQGVERILGDRISSGLVIAKHGFAGTHRLSHIAVREAGHPEPDADGVKAAAEIRKILADTGTDDLVIGLLSGGASALFCCPAEGISLADLQDINHRLLACGASINEINAVRKHLSMVKGGQTARLASPSTALEFSISDVVGDDPGTIGSGPFAADATTFQDARRILTDYGLWLQVADSVRAHIISGCDGQCPETPKPGDPVFRRVHRLLCANNGQALEAASRRAAELGYVVHVVPDPVTGEARDAAAELVRSVQDLTSSVSNPMCVLAGGETTVTLPPDAGAGGRNQELALAAALELQGTTLPMCLLSAGTDGNDGTTSAAGAVVDTKTIERGRQLGLDAKTALDKHNAHPYFKTLRDLVITGPTGTNVMDLQIALCGCPSDRDLAL